MLPKFALTFETIGSSANLSANRKQMPVKRHLAKCLSHLVSKCLSNFLSESLPSNFSFFLKKHQLIMTLEKKN